MTWKLTDRMGRAVGGSDSRPSADVLNRADGSADRRVPDPPNRRVLGSKAAFTILEILVASAILVVIVGMVAGLTGMVMRGWHQGTSTLSRDAQLQQAYQLLQYDLEAAVITPDDRPWLWLEETAGGGLSLRWLVPATGGEGLEMVEWALEQRDALGVPTGEEWALFRENVSPDDWPTTFGLNGSIGPGRPLDGFEADRDWWRAFVLAHVLEWSWEVYVPDQNGTPIAMGATGILPTGGPQSFPVVLGDRRWQAPDRIELRMRVLSAEGVRQYDRLREEVGAGEELDAFLAQEARTVIWQFHVGGPS